MSYNENIGHYGQTLFNLVIFACMFKFYIRVFGCPMRAIEAERLKRYFIANGGKSVERKKADIVAVFGCSIIKATDKVTLAYLKTINNNKQRIIVFGCSPALSNNRIREFFDGEMLATKNLEEGVDNIFPHFEESFNNIELPASCHPDLDYADFYLKQYKAYDKFRLFHFKNKPRILITGKGCPNACSYCSVRKALGRLKSYPLETIVKTYTDAIQKNYRVFVFNGDDTGAFGLDIQNRFDNLLWKLEKLTPPKKAIRWAIDNLHPQWLIKYEETLIKLIEKGRIVDMVIPLQAATNRLLKEMRRKHTINEVLPILKKIKQTDQSIKLTTHFIIGFPGEKEEDIKAIKQVVDKDYFQHIVLLRYYESGDAPSHKITPKIPIETTQQHMQELKNYIQRKGIICQMTDYE